MNKIIYILLLSLGIIFSSNAQVERLVGPRVGITMVTAGLVANVLKKDVDLFSDENTEEWEGSLGKYGATMTQYGWQWESRFADGANITGIVEWIALVGGMEKGLFLPSVSSMVGARTVKGIEFAVGPNLSLGGIAMVIGAGYNFKFGRLNVPVNIAYVPSINKTYNHDGSEEYVYHEGYYNYEYDENGNIDWYETTYTDGYEELVSSTPEYSVTHPTGARVSIMVGFNLSK